MPNFTAGTSFSDGVTNDVTAAKLNALVADAVPTSSLSLNSTTGTIATFNSTTGTIPTLVATTLITTGAGSAATPAIQPTGDTNTGIFFPAADTIAFSEGGAEAMRINSSGQVGIGTASPSSPLHVSGSGATYVQINGGSAANQGSALKFQKNSTDTLILGVASAILGGGSTSNDSMIYTEGTNNTIFYNNSAERLRIDSSGNVGIGTTSPAAKLHIAKTISQTDIDTADQIINLVNTATDTSGNLSGIRLRQENGTNTANSFIGLSSTGNSATRANLIIATPNTSGNSTERLRIDSSGNVGIGTSPATTLNIEKSSTSGNISLFPAIRLKNTNASLGNNSSTFNYSLIQVQSGNGAVDSSYGARYDSGLSGVYFGTESSHPLTLQTAGVERIRIDSSGNCSIGTATALSKLHVHGDLTLSNATTAVTASTSTITPPATVAGYLTVSINGTSRKIAYYAT